MSDMTLEQAREALAIYSDDLKQPALDLIYDCVAAIDAHLTRAPVQVTDEDVERAFQAMDAKFRETFPGKISEEDKPLALVGIRAALESLSARLAQPVVADVENLVANLQSVRDRWIASTKHDGLDGDFDILLDAINYIKRSQPRPQVAQGGEAKGEAVAVVSGSDTVLGCESRSLHWLIKDPYSIQPGTKLYTHPAERAAAPEERYTNPHDDRYDSGYTDGWNDCRKAMLSAAPTLAGKGKAE